MSGAYIPQDWTPLLLSTLVWYRPENIYSFWSNQTDPNTEHLRLLLDWSDPSSGYLVWSRGSEDPQGLALLHRLSPPGRCGGPGDWQYDTNREPQVSPAETCPGTRLAVKDIFTECKNWTWNIYLVFNILSTTTFCLRSQAEENNNLAFIYLFDFLQRKKCWLAISMKTITNSFWCRLPYPTFIWLLLNASPMRIADQARSMKTNNAV